MKPRQLYSVLFLLFTCGTLLSVSAKTPKHGWLKTYENYLLNEKGNIVQLKGMSFYWSKPGWNCFSDYYYSKEVANGLIDDWNCTVLRGAYAYGNTGYNYVQNVIDAAIAKGIYVIIDWHSHNAHEQEGDAISFFKGKAQEYKNTPNVIFEVYNEPIVVGGDEKDGSVGQGEKTWAAIKPYLERVTRAIRSTGSKNLIILGTPYFCQHVGVAAADPVLDSQNGNKPFENVAYAFHFYAASHGPEAMYVAQEGTGGEEANYLQKGVNALPIFISEWGTSHSDGGQQIDAKNTQWWFDNYVNKYHLSTCNWSVSSCEASSAFSGGMNPSASGQIVKKLLSSSVDEWVPEWVEGLKGPAIDTVFNMSDNYHPAASFNRYFGSSVDSSAAGYSYRDAVDRRLPGTRGYKVLKATTSTSENWVSYFIKPSSPTQYILFRYLAPEGSSGKVEVLVDGSKTGEVNLSATTGNTWEYAVVPADVASGEHTLKFNFVNPDGELKIEWFELTDSSEPPVVGTVIKRGISTIPVAVLPSENGLSVTLPPAHGYTAYTIFGANGRVVRSAALDNRTRHFGANNLSNGMWFVTLDKNGSRKLMRTFVGNR